MKQMSDVISYKLQLLKEEYHLTNDQLGETMGVTRQTVANYLKGEQIISSVQLFRLAQHFNVSLTYFFEEDRPPTFSFMFRADNPEKNVDPSFYSFIEKKLRAYYDVLEMGNEAGISFLPESYRISMDRNLLSQNEKETIRLVADKQRKVFGIEGDMNIDIYSVLERNNIHIYTFLYRSPSVDALSAYSKEKGAFILLHDQETVPEERKIFSVAHELAHLIFHREHYEKGTETLTYKNYRQDLNEKIANQFASYFLIPRDILAKYSFYFRKGRYFSVENLLDLKKEFGVSAQAMLLALKDENYITPPIYGHLLKRLNEQGYKNREPLPMSSISKNQKLNFILKNLVIEEKITTNKLAEVLNIGTKEARQLAKEWANAD